MPAVTVLSGDKMDAWDEFVASHESGSVYHTSHWLEMVQQAYGHRPNYFVIEDEYGAIRAGLPAFIITGAMLNKRMVSLPCAQYCNPLVRSQNDYDLLMENVVDFTSKNNINCCEIKFTDDFAFDNKNTGESISGYSTYLLDIDRPLDSVFGSFHKSCIRQHINKSSGNGLQLRMAQNDTDLLSFYILYANMRRQKGLLPQPYIFFSSLWETMSRSNNIEVLLAEYDDRIISGVMLLKFKDTVIYEYGATDSGMQHLKPSHFLLWEAIQRSQHQGYKRFDFGRTSDDNEGLSLFKARWGTTRQTLPYCYIPGMKGVAKIRHNELTTRLMKYAITKSPPTLCHLMGRILYRYLV